MILCRSVDGHTLRIYRLGKNRQRRVDALRNLELEKAFEEDL